MLAGACFFRLDCGYSEMSVFLGEMGPGRSDHAGLGACCGVPSDMQMVPWYFTTAAPNTMRLGEQTTQVDKCEAGLKESDAASDD